MHYSDEEEIKKILKYNGKHMPESLEEFKTRLLNYLEQQQKNLETTKEIWIDKRDTLEKLKARDSEAWIEAVYVTESFKRQIFLIETIVRFIEE